MYIPQIDNKKAYQITVSNRATLLELKHTQKNDLSF